MNKHKKARLQKLMSMGDKCVVSGESCSTNPNGSFAQFQLHHIDSSKKSPNYYNIIRRRSWSEELVDELNKCIILRSDIHAIAEDQGIRGTLGLGGEVVNFQSGCVWENKLHCFTTESLPLMQCLVLENGTIIQRNQAYLDRNIPKWAKSNHTVVATTLSNDLIFSLYQGKITITHNCKFMKFVAKNCDGREIMIANGKLYVLNDDSFPCYTKFEFEGLLFPAPAHNQFVLALEIEV